MELFQYLENQSIYLRHKSLKGKYQGDEIQHGFTDAMDSIGTESMWAVAGRRQVGSRKMLEITALLHFSFLHEQRLV